MMGTVGLAALLLGVGWVYAREPAVPLQVVTNATATVANFTYQGRLVDALGPVDGNCARARSLCEDREHILKWSLANERPMDNG